jgi:DNA-binding MarR family transcriptional regulator
MSYYWMVHWSFRWTALLPACGLSSDWLLIIIKPDLRSILNEHQNKAIVMKEKYTPLQGQYLAFMNSYSKIHGIPPAEADLERYFKVACSSVHRMILTLEQRGLITRTPGVARSIRVLLSYQELPELK